MTEDRLPLLGSERHAQSREKRARNLLILLAQVATMTMADDREDDVPPAHVRRTFNATIEALCGDKRLAAKVIGLIEWPVGGTTRQEWAAVRPYYDPQDYTLRSTPEAARHTANVWGPGARAVTRRVTDWPDDSRYTSPWRDIDDEEHSSAFPNDEEHASD